MATRSSGAIAHKLAPGFVGAGPTAHKVTEAEKEAWYQEQLRRRRDYEAYIFERSGRTLAEISASRGQPQAATAFAVEAPDGLSQADRERLTLLRERLEFQQQYDYYQRVIGR